MNGLDERLRPVFLALARAAVSSADSVGEIASFQRRTAFFDTAIDAMFTDLEEFQSFEGAIAKDPTFVERFGAGEAVRCALQLVYNYFRRADSLRWDAELAAQLIADFEAELAEPDWRYVLLANLQHFSSEAPLIPLPDGLSIRHRTFDDLKRELGWGDGHLRTLTEDWSGPGASAHILYLEERYPKAPDNVVLANTPTGVATFLRALRALRLYRRGDVGIGQMFYARAATFHVGSGGVLSGSSAPANPFGESYTLDLNEATDVAAIYEELRALDASEQTAANIALALGRFDAMYGRSFGYADQVVDSAIAFESLLGSDQELSFKLAFRVSSLLGRTSDERVGVFSMIRDFYSLRSRIVHGSQLRQRDWDRMRDQGDVQGALRRLLRAVIRFEVAGNQFTRKFVERELDLLLLDDKLRPDLQVRMGLVQAMPPSCSADAH